MLTERIERTGRDTFWRIQVHAHEITEIPMVTVVDPEMRVFPWTPHLKDPESVTPLRVVFRAGGETDVEAFHTEGEARLVFDPEGIDYQGQRVRVSVTVGGETIGG